MAEVFGREPFSIVCGRVNLRMDLCDTLKSDHLRTLCKQVDESPGPG